MTSDSQVAGETLVATIARELKNGHIAPIQEEVRVERTGWTARFRPAKRSDKRWISGSLTIEPDTFEPYPESAVGYQKVMISEDGEIDILYKENRPLSPQKAEERHIDGDTIKILRALASKKSKIQLYEEYGR